MSMMIHCGGRAVDYEELAGVPLPEETTTYKPVAYHDLVMNVKNIADDLLVDKTYEKANYALSKDDQRFFAVLQYRDNETENIGYAIGLRSSHNRSMSIGMCIGAQVFVCDNLAFTGSVKYMRTHTKNVFQDLEDKLVSTIYSSKDKFANILKDKDNMQNVIMNDDKAYSFLGRLGGYGILQSQQLSKAYKLWRKPPHVEFEDNSLWSLYNACTEALKSTQPNKILEKHIALHKYATS